MEYFAAHSRVEKGQPEQDQAGKGTRAGAAGPSGNIA